MYLKEKENRVACYVDQICIYLNEMHDAKISLVDTLNRAESEGLDKKALNKVAREHFKTSQNDELQAKLNQQRNLEEVYRQALKE